MSAGDCVEKKSDTGTTVTPSNQPHPDYAYYIPYDEDRALTVYQGQVYYKSSGLNSSDYNLVLITSLEQPITCNTQEIYIYEEEDLLLYTFVGLTEQLVRGEIAKPYGFDLQGYAKLKNQSVLNPAEIKKLTHFNFLEADILDSILTIHYPKGESYPSAKNRWQPIIMINGTKPLVSLDALPEPYDNKYSKMLKKLVDSKKEKTNSYIIKSYSYLRDDIKAKEQITPSQHFSKFQAKRVGLKRFLLISSRLAPKHYTDAQLVAGGLNPEEIKQARVPIHLRKDYHAQVDLNFPDTFNDWLIARGATYIQNLYNNKPKLYKPAELPSYSTSSQFTFLYRPLPDTEKPITKILTKKISDPEKKPKPSFINFKNINWPRFKHHSPHPPTVADEKASQKTQAIANVIKQLYELIPDLKEFNQVTTTDEDNIKHLTAMSNLFYVRCPAHADEINYYLRQMTSVITGIEVSLDAITNKQQMYAISVLADRASLKQFLDLERDYKPSSAQISRSYDDSRVELFFMG